MTQHISVSTQAFVKLNKLARLMSSDTSTVIDRLIDYWENTSDPTPSVVPVAESGSEQPQATTPSWRSARGETLPIGMELKADYLQRELVAKVVQGGIWFEGEVFQNPSSAANAAKLAAGASPTAASTNGWQFWRFLDESTARWLPIDSLRAR